MQREDENNQGLSEARAAQLVRITDTSADET